MLLLLLLLPPLSEFSCPRPVLTSTESLLSTQLSFLPSPPSRDHLCF